MFVFKIQGVQQEKAFNKAKTKFIFCKSKVVQGMYLIAYFNETKHAVVKFESNVILDFKTFVAKLLPKKNLS